MLSSPVQFNHLLLQNIAGRGPPENNPENLFLKQKAAFQATRGKNAEQKNQDKVLLNNNTQNH
jgi:hypothetical protein